MKSSRILLMAVAVISTTMTVRADDYKILFISSPSFITVDGRQKKAGDVISQDSRIVWAKEEQAMRVENMANSTRKVLSQGQVKKPSIPLPLSSYFQSQEVMGCREGDITSTDVLRAVLPDTL